MDRLVVHGLDCGVAQGLRKQSICAKTVLLVLDVHFLVVHAVHPLIVNATDGKAMGVDVFVEMSCLASNQFLTIFFLSDLLWAADCFQ